MKLPHLIGYPVVIIVTIIIMIIICKECRHHNPPDPTKPREIISACNAKELYDSYTENRACIIKVFEGKQDSTLVNLCPSKRKPMEVFDPSRSFLLKKDFLDEYIEYVHKIAADTLEVTGYRLFLGNYPDKKNFDNGKPIPDRRRNTFFIVPTLHDKVENKHRSFTFIDKNKDGIPELIYLEDIFDNPKVILECSNTPKKNAAGIFSSLDVFEDEISTIGNEIGGSPPY